MNYFKKINKVISGLIILAILITPFASFPKKAHAVIPTQEVGTSLFQQIINTISTVSSEVLQYSNEYKESVLDPLAYTVAKMIIRQVTSSIVNWINSGFQGSPAFVTDPNSFFLDIADQITGEFIAKSGTLTELCSNFNLDLRLALAFKYRPNVQKRYTCTLSTIINNGINAVENASINGFTAGDFRQGGLPAFVSLTTEPQNNVYGAYIEAEYDLSWRVLSAQGQQQKELDQGKGFLSWKKCTLWSDSSNAVSNSLDPWGMNTSPGSTDKKTCLKYETQTPGSTIAGALETQLGSPVRQLELADEFGEIVNALFAHLVTRVLQGGLTNVNKKDNSGLSYLDKIDKDMNTNNAAILNIKKQILSKIDDQIKKTEQLKIRREGVLNKISGVKNIFDDARVCYVAKIASSTPPISSSEKEAIEESIKELDSQVSENIAPSAVRMMDLTQVASSSLKELKDIQSGASAATTVDDIISLNDRYTFLLNSGLIPNSNDIGGVAKDENEVNDLVTNMKPIGIKALNDCRGIRRR